MTPLDAVLPPDVVHRLGWTLVHLVWQAAAVALVLAVVLAFLKNGLANVRYLAACAALVMMAALPLGTFIAIDAPPSGQPIHVAEPPPVDATPAATDASPPAVVSSLNITAETPPGVAPTTPIEPPSSPGVDWLAILEAHLDLIVAGWLIGVALLSGRLALSWYTAQRIRRGPAEPAPVHWQRRLAELAERLGITRTVAMVESSLAQVPIVIGHLRPVILLPLGALTGLPPEQIEAVLAHELAHIRRYDYLVNLIQTVIETLLFHHPAVWWVSRRIRAEREHCCDDHAVALCGDRLAYARALVALETLRPPTADLALAAAGGSLLARIRRLVGSPDPQATPGHRWKAGLIGLALVAGLTVGLYWANLARAEGEAPEDPEIQSTKQLLFEIRDAYAKAVQDLRHLEIVASSRLYEWDDTQQEWVSTPARTHARAWIEELPRGRTRIEFDPQILPWTNGARPYAENRYLLAYDGEAFRKIDFVYNHERGIYTSRLSDTQAGWQRVLDAPWSIGTDLLLMEMNGGPLHGLSEAIRIAEAGLLESKYVYAHAAEVIEGSRAVVLVEIGPDRYEIHKKYRLNPERNFALLSHESFGKGGFARNRRPYAGLYVRTAEQISDHIWLPTEWMGFWQPPNSNRRASLQTHKVQSIRTYDPASSETIFTAADIELGSITEQMPIGPLSVNPPPGFEEPPPPEAFLPKEDGQPAPADEEEALRGHLALKQWDQAAKLTATATQPAEADYWEGPLRFDRPVLLNIDADELEAHWIEFACTDSRIEGRLHVSYPSGPKAKWLIRVQLADDKGLTYGSVVREFENSGIIKGVAKIHNEDLVFTFAREGNIDQATRFRVYAEDLYAPPSEKDRQHKPFEVFGRVTDGDGKPISDVEITAHAGIGTLRRTGITVSGPDGRYTLRFGPGILVSNTPLNVGTQAATICARTEGFYEQNLCRHGNLGITDEPEPADHSHYVDLVRPDQPYRLDFVMVPAARIEGRLTDTTGQPIRQENKLHLTGEELYPSSSVLAGITTDADGRFVVESVPCKSFWFEYDDARTEAIDFAESATYHLILVHDQVKGTLKLSERSSTPMSQTRPASSQPGGKADAPAAYELHGTVIDAPDFHKALDFLENARFASDEEFRLAFDSIPQPGHAGDAVVTLVGRSTAKTTVTDAEGHFSFTGLPPGHYKVSATAPSRPTGIKGVTRTATAEAEARVEVGSPYIPPLTLKLSTLRVTIKGRIISPDGRPIPSAKVTGVLDVHDTAYEQFLEANEAPTWTAHTDADGRYELHGMDPMHWHHVAAALVNGRARDNVDIRVEARGFVQRKEDAPEVPLLPEDAVCLGRRWLAILNQAQQRLGNIQLAEKEGWTLPAATGNTITGIDIVLQPMEAPIPTDADTAGTPAADPSHTDPPVTQPADNSDGVSVQERTAGGNANMRYFLIGAAEAEARAAEEETISPIGPEAKLLLVLPGGDGGPDFLPFVKRIYRHALSDDYLVAQLVAPRWSDEQAQKLVWPTETNPRPNMEFSTEQFMAAVVNDVHREHRFSRTFTLGWSSSGPACYAASLTPSVPVRGTFVAMSVFKPDQLPPLERARTHTYFILHSPQDFIPLRMAEEARDLLADHGAAVELATYDGGHGWRGDVFGSIRRGMAFLEANVLRTHVYLISDLLEAFDPSNPSYAGQQSVARIVEGIHNVTGGREEWESGRHTIDVWRDRWAIIHTSARNHQRIDDYLNQSREPYRASVAVEAKFVTVDLNDRDKLRQWTAEDKMHQSDDGAATRILTPDEAEALMGRLQSIRSSSVCQAPRILAPHGMPLEITVPSSDPLELPLIDDPTTRVAVPIACAMLTGQADASPDRHSVTLTAVAEHIIGLEQFNPAEPDDLPQLAAAAVTQDVPDGQTLLISVPFQTVRPVAAKAVKNPSDGVTFEPVFEPVECGSEPQRRLYLLIRPKIIIRRPLSLTDSQPTATPP